MSLIKKLLRHLASAHRDHHARRAERHAWFARHREGCVHLRAARQYGHVVLGGVRRARAIDGEDKEARRQAILDAAERLFAERHELANVADVAVAAGLAKGTVYLYFQTKEEIYLALHLRHVEHFFTTLIARLHRDDAVDFSEISELAREHIIGAPIYLPLSALCIGFQPTAVPMEAAVAFQTQLTGWLIEAGAGLERHFPKLPAGEGVRLLKHSYAMMVGLFNLMRGERDDDPKCPVLPGMGTYQEEATLALSRYWAHVAGISDPTQKRNSKEST
jgi:AcrR family transcriptional regulator